MVFGGEGLWEVMKVWMEKETATHFSLFMSFPTPPVMWGLMKRMDRYKSESRPQTYPYLDPGFPRLQNYEKYISIVYDPPSLSLFRVSSLNGLKRKFKI